MVPASPQPPFFLFVNYYDPHEPYHPIPEIGNRFGDATRTIPQRILAEIDGVASGIDVPRSRREQAALIAGYDSGLAYADSQIAGLLRLLRSSPDGSNTYFIVFGGHGQAFGTHQRYGHGWGLNGELLHVPLIIAGPGIPHGLRIGHLVRLQQLLATVLDLSGAKVTPPGRKSLRCTWTSYPSGCDPNPLVISELGWNKARARHPFISITTPKWHFIRDADGNLQLYYLTNDPEEKLNLASSPEHRSELATLQSRLLESIQASSRPWLGEDYLWALGQVQYSLLFPEHLVNTGWHAVECPATLSPKGETARGVRGDCQQLGGTGE